MIVGITSPGKMGAAMGKRLAENGVEVRTLLEGRSDASVERAADAGMTGVDEAAFVASDIILSILPPADALAIAERLRPTLAEAASKPIYVDCNAVNPETARQIALVAEGSGAAFVDGGIIGLPPTRTRRGATLFVSGERARELEALNAFGLRVRALKAPVGAASSLKMSYAGITKGTFAIGSGMILAASRAGAAAALHAELELTHPGLTAFLARGIGDMHEKTYRWVSEMREIAAFVGEDRAEHDIYEAIAGLYERLTADHRGQGVEAGQLDDFFVQPGCDGAGDGATTDNEAAITKRELELYDAMIAEDFGRLDDLLAENCTYVHSNGVGETKIGYLQGVRNGLYEYELVEARDVVRHLAGDMAVAVGTVRMVVGERGKPKSEVPLLSTLVWAKDGGRWRLLRRHATRIPAR